MLFATAPEMFKGADAAAWETLRAAGQAAALRRRLLCLWPAGLGFVDLVVEASLQPYDYCSLVPIVEGAGGIITDWQGRRLGLHSDGRVVAAGDRALHARCAADGARPSLTLSVL